MVLIEFVNHSRHCVMIPVSWTFAAVERRKEEKGWCAVTNEVMEKITDAEAQARELTADAARQAAESVGAARAAASQRIEEAQLQARQIAAQAEEETRKLSGVRIDAAREEARAQAKSMVAAADENMKAAVNEIIREIFKKWQ